MAGLWVASWRETMPDIEFDARHDWFREHITGLMTSGHAVIGARSTTDGALLGFVTIEPLTMYLDQLVVAVEAKGTGVAAALVQEARLRSPAGLVIHVNDDNARALAFYRRQGFLVTGTGGRSRLSGKPFIAMRWTSQQQAAQQ